MNTIITIALILAGVWAIKYFTLDPAVRVRLALQTQEVLRLRRQLKHAQDYIKRQQAKAARRRVEREAQAEQKPAEPIEVVPASGPQG